MFTIDDKTIDIFGGENKSTPLIVFNTVQGEGQKVYEKCIGVGCHPFTLAAIGNLNWNDDLSPWEIQLAVNGSDGFGGKAFDYLKTLTEEILPAVLKKLDAEPEYIAVAGYSLAGLFALYSTYKTNIFSRAASVSGSMWFPHFTEFVLECEMKCKPDCIYFSLGNKESNTRNKILKQVQSNTQKVYDHIKDMGVPSFFEINSGNHFNEPELRMAKGIKWILTQ